jgi:hypothetical protein
VIVQVLEIERKTLQFLVIGQSPKDGFIYFTFIFEGERREHFSFPTNDPNYRWNPSTSLVLSPISAVANCVSSAKIMMLRPDGTFHLFQFDVEAYLGKLLQQSIRTLEHFQSELIERQESRSLVVLLLGYIFYSENREKWFAGLTLVELPVDGAGVRRIHDEIRGYSVRPPGNQIYDDLEGRLAFFRHIPLPNVHQLNCLTTEMSGNVQGIPFPDLNLIVLKSKPAQVPF